MAATNQTDLSNVLKILYPQTRCRELLYTGRPFLGRLKKNEKMGGKHTHIATRYSGGPGVANVFATAQTRKGPSKYSKFEVTRSEKFGLFSIDGHALKASADDAGSLVTDLKQIGDGVLNTLMNGIAKAIYGNGGGAIGQISSGSATTTLTLTKRADLVNFEVGMFVASDDTDGSGAGAADDAEYLEISAIDRQAGTITKTGAAWNSTGNFAANDYLFRQGTIGSEIKGLAAWVKRAAPAGGESFFGQDRSLDRVRLAGYPYTASAATDGSIERTLINASHEVHLEGGMTDVAFMNPLDRRQLINELGAKTNYVRQPARGPNGDMATIGYRGVIVEGASGPIEVYGDPWCDKGTCYLLMLDTWTLGSLGPCPHWLDEDKLGNIVREYNANAYEGRLGSYYQLYTDAPGWNANIDLSAVVN